MGGQTTITHLACAEKSTSDGLEDPTTDLSCAPGENRGAVSTTKGLATTTFVFSLNHDHGFATGVTRFCYKFIP